MEELILSRIRKLAGATALESASSCVTGKGLFDCHKNVTLITAKRSKLRIKGGYGELLRSDEHRLGNDGTETSRQC